MKGKKAAASVTSTQILADLHSRYPRPEFVLQSEITLQGRRIDAVCMRMWGDRSLVGFEIKVSRSDWQRELKSIEKSRAWASCVDQFIVVAPPEVVQDSELPVGWGLMEFRDNGLRLKVQPHPVSPSHSLPREIAARLLDRLVRKTTDEAQRAAWDLRESIRKEIEDRYAKDEANEANRLRAENERLSKQLAELCEVAGVPLHGWDRDSKLMRVARSMSEVRDAAKPDRYFLVNLRRDAERLQTVHARLIEAIDAAEKVVAA